MATHDEKVGKEIIDILIRVTIIVKVLPFVYAATLLLTLTSYFLFSDNVSIFLDRMLYVSPLAIIPLYILSKCMHFCKWHRAECLLPILPIATVFVDYNIYSFGEYAAGITLAAVLVIFFGSLLNGYFVFIRNKKNVRARCQTAITRYVRLLEGHDN
jgi:hypothetical protein